MHANKYFNFNLLSALLVVASLLFFGGYVCLQEIKYIKVFGVDKIKTQKLKSIMLSNVLGKKIFSNFEPVAKKLLEFPPVSKVSIKRSWPNSLHINITEREPVARFNERIVFANKEVAHVNNFTDINRFVDLTSMEITDSNAVMIDKALNLSIKLKKVLYPLDLKLKKVYIRPHTGWGFVASDGVQVNLGLYDLDERLRKYTNIYASYITGRVKKVVSMDLRYINGIALHNK